jgi:ABC-type taurine transport system ATPase subunit
MATILVTHSVEEALDIGDRIVLVAGTPGRIVRQVRPEFNGKGTECRAEGELFYRYLEDVSTELSKIATVSQAT